MIELESFCTHTERAQAAPYIRSESPPHFRATTVSHTSDYRPHYHGRPRSSRQLRAHRACAAPSPTALATSGAADQQGLLRRRPALGEHPLRLAMERERGTNQTRRIMDPKRRRWLRETLLRWAGTKGAAANNNPFHHAVSIAVRFLSRARLILHSGVGEEWTSGTTRFAVDVDSSIRPGVLVCLYDSGAPASNSVSSRDNMLFTHPPICQVGFHTVLDWDDDDYEHTIKTGGDDVPLTYNSLPKFGCGSPACVARLPFSLTRRVRGSG